MIYQWKPGSHLSKHDAQTVGAHLEALREQSGGLTARLVVDDAKADASPTHECFEWDDAAAADQWRLEQARHILACVTVTVGEESATPTRAFVVVSERDEQHYTSIGIAMADPVMRAQVIARAVRELEAWQKKYRELEELAEVFRAIDTVRVA